MTDEEKVKDYDRLQYEYTQGHQKLRRQETVKNIDIEDVFIKLESIFDNNDGYDRRLEAYEYLHRILQVKPPETKICECGGEMVKVMPTPYCCESCGNRS